MRRVRIGLSVLIIGGGLIVMAIRPREAGEVAPWIGMAVGYWFGGEHELRIGRRAKATGSGDPGAGER